MTYCLLQQSQMIQIKYLIKQIHQYHVSKIKVADFCFVLYTDLHFVFFVQEAILSIGNYQDNVIVTIIPSDMLFQTYTFTGLIHGKVSEWYLVNIFFAKFPFNPFSPPHKKQCYFWQTGSTKCKVILTLCQITSTF